MAGRINMIRKAAGDFIAYRLLVVPLTVLLLCSCSGPKGDANGTLNATRLACITQACFGIEGSGTRDIPPPPAPYTHGRYIGTVKIGSTTYFGDALITVDGAVRLFVGAPASYDGALQMSKPNVSE